MIITPDNIRSLSHYLHPDNHIGPRSIVFPSVDAHEDLFAIPLASPKELNRDATFRITIGMRPPAMGESSSPAIGLKGYDGFNAFSILDPSFYSTVAPCIPADGDPALTEHENNLVPDDTPHSSQYVMVFNPFHRYGTCSSAQNGGYTNVATFKYFLDVRAGVELCGISGLNDGETYEFYYFIVELIS